MDCLCCYQPSANVYCRRRGKTLVGHADYVVFYQRSAGEGKSKSVYRIKHELVDSINERALVLSPHTARDVLSVHFLVSWKRRLDPTQSSRLVSEEREICHEKQWLAAFLQK